MKRVGGVMTSPYTTMEIKNKNGHRKPMKAKCLIYFTIFAFLFAGCIPKEVSEELGATFNDMTELSSAVLFYQMENNKWPDSIAELKTFCLKEKERFPLITEWDKYKDVSFQGLPDGRLRIEYYGRDQHSGPISITVSVPRRDFNEPNSYDYGRKIK